MADLKKKISALPSGTPLDTDIIPYVDLVTNTTKKALKSGLKGDKGDKGDDGVAGAQGPQGIQGIQGPKGDDGLIVSVTGTMVDNTDPANPIINSDGTKFSYLYGGCEMTHTFTDNGNGTINVPSCDCYLFDNTTFQGTPEKYTLPALTNQALTDGVQNYIVGDYNGGNPIMKVITDVSLITESSVIPILSIFRNGNFLHTQNWDALGVGLANKVHQSIVKTQRYRRESGLAIGETGTRNVTLTAGKVWVGAVPMSLDAINTATDNLYFWKHVAGVWTGSTITQYDNTQYDNGTDLATLGAGRYGVSWIFRGVESQKHLYCVLGTGNYTLVQAQAATVPALPVAISSHAVLVGKIIVQKTDATATSIQSAFDNTFSYAGVSSHSDLTNLAWTSSGHTGTASSLAAFDGSGVASSVLLNTLAPVASPTFTGTVTTPAIKITGGTPGVGKVLTSDADGDATWTTPAAGGSQSEPLADYAGQAIIGVLGTYVFTSAKTLARCSITADSIPVGSNLIVELRKNSTSSGNILSSTLQIATTDTLTNGKKTVSITDNDTFVAGDYVSAYLTSVGSTTPALNPVVMIDFS